jgi:histidinol dehydrogenase
MELVRTTGLGGRRARARIVALLDRRQGTDRRVTPAVERILRDVRKNGDKALRSYASRFDGLPATEPLRITEGELRMALAEIPSALRHALQTAADNIRRFAERQLPGDWDLEPTPGLTVGQRVRPLGSVGCYVPSGRHPLPSTLLMTAIPAQVAGVPRIVAVSPKPAPETLAAAALVGVTEFYRVGGAHAVAALAYGTQSIPRVQKIVGPGNSYVTAAKKLVAAEGDVAIDMLAGPTEIIVASETGSPEAIAADLVAQAEHDPEAVAIFITTRAQLAKAVVAEAKRQARTNPIAQVALDRSGLAIVAGSLEEVRELTNLLAGEHLTVDSLDDLHWVENAGSVFVGPWSPQPMGDYISGPNHTLPTGGQAALRGGLSVFDYLKLITVQQYSPEALQALGPHAAALADAEGLSGHAAAIRGRMAGQ